MKNKNNMMSSDELNKKIGDLCDSDELQIIGGKCIPYIGWYWRNVDFNAETNSFGIMPAGIEMGAPFKGFVGFMENNKWGYGYTRDLTKEEWQQVKKLLMKVVKNPTKQTTRELWDYIQTFNTTKKVAV